MPFRTFAVAIFMLFAASAPAVADDAKGALVLSLGDSPGTNAPFGIHIRSKDGEHTDFVTFQSGGFFSSPRDFEGPEGQGTVRMLELAPGAWEIYVAGMTVRTGLYSADALTSKDGLSIPFTVKAGETVYIGDYLASSGPVSISVRDRSARDLAIARTKYKISGDVTIAVPDAAALQNSMFHSAP